MLFLSPLPFKFQWPRVSQNQSVARIVNKVYFPERGCDSEQGRTRIEGEDHPKLAT